MAERAVPVVLCSAAPTLDDEGRPATAARLGTALSAWLAAGEERMLGSLSGVCGGGANDLSKSISAGCLAGMLCRDALDALGRM